MWKNSSKADILDGLANPESQGWLKEETEYSIDWESKEVLQRVKATLDFLDKGCSCKTGCKPKRCSCKKKERSCGAGCECKGCTNIHLKDPDSTNATTLSVCTQEESEDEVSEYETSDSETEHELETEIITDFNFDDAVNLF